MAFRLVQTEHSHSPLFILAIIKFVGIMEKLRVECGAGVENWGIGREECRMSFYK